MKKSHRANKSFWALCAPMALGILAACSSEPPSDSTLPQTPEELYKEYIQLVDHNASLERLAGYWDLSFLEASYEVEPDYSLQLFEYALMFPSVFDEPPAEPVVEVMSDDQACLLGVGDAADGEGLVATHLLARKSEQSWRFSDVHAQFLSTDMTPEVPDCSFSEQTKEES